MGRLSALPAADVWVHGASAGDARAIAPLVRALGAARPELSLLYTAQTETGLTMARQLMAAPVRRAPWPVGPIPGWALRHVRPRLVVWEYLELWPAWVRACRARGVVTAVVDGRVSHRSLRVRPLLRRAAASLDLFCARSAADAEAARRLGVRPECIRITGNGKHDGARVAPPQPSAALRAAVPPVDVVVGSLHRDEEAQALSALAAAGLTAVIAPRYPRRAAALLARARRLGVTARRRTDPGCSARWVILDTIGELAAAYALGRGAVVGGTFGRRQGQTLVEPAAHGLPVVHGPAIGNVGDEVEALDGRGAIPVADWPAAFDAIRRALAEGWIDPRPALAALGGATDRNLAALLDRLPRPGQMDPRRGGCYSAPSS